MKAQTITLTLTIRPSYGDVEEHVKPEVEVSLEWLRCDHNAIRLEWGEVGEGEWPDDEDEEGDGD